MREMSPKFWYRLIKIKKSRKSRKNRSKRKIVKNKNKQQVLKKTPNQISSTISILISHRNNVLKISLKKLSKKLYHKQNSNRKLCYCFIVLSSLSTKKEAGNMLTEIWCLITLLQMFFSKICHKSKTRFLIVTMYQSMSYAKFSDGHVMLSLNRLVYPLS